MNTPRPYRSLFWPVLLIGVGVAFLLGNLGIISPVNINTLLNLWPLILIVIGLDIIFGRRWPAVGALIGLLAVAAVILFLIFGSALGIATSPGLKVRDIREPLGAATAAEVRLNFASQPVSVRPLSDPGTLFQAHLEYYGDLNYSSSGDPTRHITLSREISRPMIGFDFSSNPRWDIGLSPEVPIDLTLDGASGSGDVDLTGLNLTGFVLDQGSGSFNVSLPASRQAYTAELHGGSGSLSLRLPANTDLTLRMDRGSGSTSVRLPAGAAVRLEVRNSGSGSVSVASGMTKVSGESGRKEGVWQTPGYDSAAYQINIVCTNLGSGSFSLD